jgi:hypothetical protein
MLHAALALLQLTAAAARSRTMPPPLLLQPPPWLSGHNVKIYVKWYAQGMLHGMVLVHALV